MQLSFARAEGPRERVLSIRTIENAESETGHRFCGSRTGKRNSIRCARTRSDRDCAPQSAAKERDAGRTDVQKTVDDDAAVHPDLPSSRDDGEKGGGRQGRQGDHTFWTLHGLRFRGGGPGRRGRARGACPRRGSRQGGDHRARGPLPREIRQQFLQRENSSAA